MQSSECSNWGSYSTGNRQSYGWSYGESNAENDSAHNGQSDGGRNLPRS